MCKGDDKFKVVWASQWEPPGIEGRQFAFRCYKQHFDPENLHPEESSNEDIAIALDRAQDGSTPLPQYDMLVGGFPCQDYSVAKPLSQANGIEGKKGVLWWEIFRLIEMKPPQYVLLENVDRMLKSPATQRGRDFAIMLSCLSGLGYSVEWRVINAADYGFPQKRRRVYIYAEKTEETWGLSERLLSTGVMAESFPVEHNNEGILEFPIGANPYEVSQSFGKERKVSQFLTAGVMQNGRVATKKTTPVFLGDRQTLGSIVLCEKDIPESFFVDEEELERWKIYKSAKRVPRKNKATGHEYNYSEGSMAFPDYLDQPARTILTGEGGKSASRFKHIIKTESGRYRRLIPEELELLQGFPVGWTDTGMSDNNRAFCMGNALVVGLPRRIGQVIGERHNRAVTSTLAAASP